MSTEQDAAECYRGYHNAFVEAGKSKDPTLLRPFTHIPLMAVGGGGARVFSTLEESDQRWSRILNGLPDDYDHSIEHALDVTVISDTSAIVSVEVSRHRRGGEEYDRFRASYVLVKDGHWQLTTWLVHDSMARLQTVSV